MSLLISAILARLLTPSDFGLIAMVVVFSNFVVIFSDFGLVSAIVQKQEVSDEALSSIFWINVGLGVLLTVALAAAAPLIAAFYSQPRLAPIVVFISTTFFITSFSNVSFWVAHETHEFQSPCHRHRLRHRGLWHHSCFLGFFRIRRLEFSLVHGSFQCFYGCFGFDLCSLWVPHFLVGLQHVKGLLGFGANLTGFSFVNYFAQNMDNLLVGRFLGSAALGFYNLAYNLLVLPVTSISNVVGDVMFPALSIIQHDKQLVRDSYVGANRYIAAASFPLMTWVLVVGPSLSGWFTVQNG